MTRTNDARFLIDSASTPGLVHTVQYVETADGWELRCDCVASSYGRKCWHVRAAREAEMGTASVATTPAISTARAAAIDAKMARFARM